MVPNLRGSSVVKIGELEEMRVSIFRSRSGWIECKKKEIELN